MDDVPLLLYASALATGLALGYVMERGGFCLTRALSNAWLMRDGAVLRAWVLALLVVMVGVEILEALSLVDVPRPPLHWLSSVVGGLLFGAGMIVAGGGPGSAWYRVGEGAIGAWVVLLGFAIGATTAGLGILSPVRVLLQKPVLTTADGDPPTLASLTGLPPWVVVAALVLVGCAWLLRGPRGAEHGTWRWPASGATVGAIIVAGWWASTFGERPAGITFAANTGHLLTYPLVGYPSRVTWSMLTPVGVAVGAFVAARRADQFGWKLPAPTSLVKIFGGGLLMGAAALVAEGCDINQGLTNSSTLALGSLLTFTSMCAGASGTVWLLFLRKT